MNWLTSSSLGGEFSEGRDMDHQLDHENLESEAIS